jgi:hypothetical protein
MMKEMNSSVKIIIVSCLILALMLPSAASSELILPTDTNQFVIDEAGVLSEADEDLLTEDLQWLADEWGTEIVVVVIESTAHYQSNDDTSGDTTDNNTNGTGNETTNGTGNETTNGTGNETTNQTMDEPMMELKEFSEALFDDWGVGNQEWQDGILVVLSINQSSDDSNWWIVPGLLWEENCCYFGMVGATSDASNDAGNWTELLLIITDDLVTAVDDFWYENEGYVYPPEDQSNTGSTIYKNVEWDGDIIPIIGGLVVCGFLLLIIILLAGRGGGGGYYGGGGGYYGGGGGGGRWYNRGGNGGYGYNNGHHGDHGQSHTPTAPSRKSSRRSSSGGISRGGSSRGGISPGRSSGGSSRGGGSRGGGSRGGGSRGGGSRGGGSRGGGSRGGGRRSR